ncbi:calcium/sodium antiporter [Albidovulum aquaemixtae]|uniref:calcium/sodium antiporter n=1 Tax=Albidovulum aquaemixtae TaxID=1542388 RepID=UPI001FE5E998|nr:calcium/sodium antiporter [Defluviimonas aquaemixtae]
MFFLIGLAGLFLGGELLVRGAVGVARRLDVPPLVIGLTIVGFGTSTPELLVALRAALEGVPALALGNVIGSNIANILLILGVAALIAPVPLRFGDLSRDFMVVIGATVIFWAMLGGGVVSRGEGVLLFLGLMAYLAACFRSAAGSAPPGPDKGPPPLLGKSLALAAAGLIAVVIGAGLLVDSASEIARSLGVSEAVIGLSIVAVGTSLPELATSVMAAMRGHPEISVGNILGSCVFNIFGIIGITAMVTPVPVDPRFAGLDMTLALASALTMFGFAVLPERVSRVGGLGLLTAYCGYMALLGPA